MFFLQRRLCQFQYHIKFYFRVSSFTNIFFSQTKTTSLEHLTIDLIKFSITHRTRPFPSKSTSRSARRRPAIFPHPRPARIRIRHLLIWRQSLLGPPVHNSYPDTESPRRLSTVKTRPFHAPSASLVPAVLASLVSIQRVLFAPPRLAPPHPPPVAEDEWGFLDLAKGCVGNVQRC